MERKLPQWYRDAVNMASEVFADAPQGVSTGMPFVALWGGGQGVTAQRTDRMCTKHPGMHQGRTPVQLDVVSEGDNGT